MYREQSRGAKTRKRTEQRRLQRSWVGQTENVEKLIMESAPKNCGYLPIENEQKD